MSSPKRFIKTELLTRLQKSWAGKDKSFFFKKLKSNRNKFAEFLDLFPEETFTPDDIYYSMGYECPICNNTHRIKVVVYDKDRLVKKNIHCKCINRQRFNSYVYSLFNPSIPYFFRKVMREWLNEHNLEEILIKEATSEIPSKLVKVISEE